MKSNEIWKPISNFEGLYEVSNLGRVKRLDKYINCRNYKKRLLKENIMKRTKIIIEIIKEIGLEN